MYKYLFLLMASAAFVLGAGENFKHSLPDGKKPWTHENFIAGAEKFSFVILPDRTGSERPGVFEEAIKKANMLQPDFILTVGDNIQGATNKNKQSIKDLREQWQELANFTAKSQAPFFYLVGNHDISYTRPGFPRANENSKAVWEEFAGKNTYYYFIYKNVLFLCLNIMEGRDSRPNQVGITDQQAAWAVDVLKKHPNVRWTMVLLHAPSAWISDSYGKIEKALRNRNYTSFAGDWHHYIKFQRRGKNHYVLATAGGISELRGIDYGEFDHITYVTVTKNGPVVTNILLDGILSDDVVTAKNIQRHYTEFLDTEPFVYDKKYPWRAIMDVYALHRGTGNEYFKIDGNQITLPGKAVKGKKVAEKVIDLDHPAPGGKLLKLVASTRAELPKGKNSSFNVHIRILDKDNKVIKSEGLTLKENLAWKYRKSFIKVPANGKKLQLVLSGVNFDSNSIGECRNIFAVAEK